MIRKEGFVTTNAEIDRRVRAIAERTIGVAEREERNGLRVVNAIELTPEQRIAYGLAPDWEPGVRRRRRR